MPIARVALDVPLDQLFDYLAPDLTEDDIGTRVLVPFGPRKCVGVVVAIASESTLPSSKLKALACLYRNDAKFSLQDLALFEFCANYYQHPLGPVILSALPPALRRQHPPRPNPAETHYRLTASGASLNGQTLPARAINQRRLLEALRPGPLPRPALLALLPSAGAALRTLLARGWVEQTAATPLDSDASRAPPAMPISAGGPALTLEQTEAVERIASELDRFGVWLLHGITGSGKTEVYLQLIEQVVAANRQALVLVPEINLTPQLEHTFRARFPGVPLVNLHSNLNEGERVRHWLAAHRGNARIILGTRLAVLTPLPRLGLIVVDEEHDSSFKQQDSLRYHARDVAVFRARQLAIPIVLGSATPSLESYHNARTGRYQLLSLTQRAMSNAALPLIRLIPLKRAKLIEGLAEPLLEALQERLQRGEQSLVFINRRGYAPALVCSQCAWVSACPRCSARLVLHLKARTLRCHHCGHETNIPRRCPDCGNQDLKPAGHGTQRVEAALQARFSSARIARIDRDSTARKHAMRDLLTQINAGEMDILVGTQMIAKGHHFPNLTLVGVLNADGALFSADFRAEERLFALLMQVAGRAGRANRAGEVLIQTEFPDHPMYQALQRHEYPAFAEQLLEQRRQAGFPPYVYQAMLRIESVQAEAAMRFATQAKASGSQLDPPEITIYDPVPAAMARIAGHERVQLLVQSASRRHLQDFLSRWRRALQESAAAQVRWVLDVDPLDG